MQSLHNGFRKTDTRALRPRPRTALLAATVLLALPAAGCFRPHAATWHEEERGLIYLFPGVGGGAWSMQAAYQGLRAAGVEGDIRVFEWKTPFFDFLGHLQNHAANRAQAAVVARQIDAFRRVHLRAPIHLVGYSAGGGMALLVAEELDSDTRVQNIVLVQPAVSTEYDLCCALRHVHGRLINFYTPTDWLILGLGTTTFGTVDRKHGPSAGKEGFDLAQAVLDERLRAKVIHRRWTSDMLHSGHIGGHLGILTFAWNREYVAPHLRAGDRSIMVTPVP